MTYDPAERNIGEVLDYVGTDSSAAAEVLAAERQGKARRSLIESLEATVAAATRAEDAEGDVQPPEVEELEGELAPVDDYPPRPFAEAISAQEAERLVTAELATGSGDAFEVTAPVSVVPR